MSLLRSSPSSACDFAASHFLKIDFLLLEFELIFKAGDDDEVRTRLDAVDLIVEISDLTVQFLVFGSEALILFLFDGDERSERSERKHQRLRVCS